ncbi:MAG TPA: LacI family DNA-binding transcriptional regulator [Chloroflexota bacterium]|nr:LacI family DNA-binding transcriptional regulator [Chloroflexota bacterium]
MNSQDQSSAISITLREVAERAGVSISTASRALSGAGRVAAETESRVVEAMQELNYRPWSRSAARYRRSRQATTGCVGVVLRVARYKFSDPYWAPVLDGLDAELTRQGFELGFVVALDELDNNHRAGLLARREYDGLILLGDFAERPEVVEAGRTVVVEGEDVLRWQGTLDVDFVTAEKRRSIYSVVEHLAALGRSRIGFVGPLASRDERAEAFPTGLGRCDLAFDPGRCVESSWTVGDGYEAANALFDRGTDVDALVCASDELALGTMRAAREAGRSLPDDLAVTGFDDVPFAASLHPALTTIRLSREAVGTVAARRVIERITDPGCPRTIQIVPTKLIVRASCAEPQPSAGDGAGTS